MHQFIVISFLCHQLGVGARLDYEYEVYRERDHVLCASGSSTQLFIDPDGLLMTDKPDYYTNWQQQWGVNADNE